MEKTTQNMDTIPPPADTQDASEYQTAIRVSTASTDSLWEPKKYVKSHVKSQIKTTATKFTSENSFSIFQAEHGAQSPTTPEISTTRQG
jgi:hypothetical protein